MTPENILPGFHAQENIQQTIPVNILPGFHEEHFYEIILNIDQ